MSPHISVIEVMHATGSNHAAAWAREVPMNAASLDFLESNRRMRMEISKLEETINELNVRVLHARADAQASGTDAFDIIMATSKTTESHVRIDKLIGEDSMVQGLGALLETYEKKNKVGDSEIFRIKEEQRMTEMSMQAATGELMTIQQKTAVLRDRSIDIAHVRKLKNKWGVTHTRVVSCVRVGVFRWFKTDGVQCVQGI
jgi:hypothetical protein